MTEVAERGIFLGDDGNATRDYNHATDNEYKSYRDKADELYKKRSKLSLQSQQAYKQGDKSKAKEYSDQAKKVLEEAEYNNRLAAEYVFRQNNTDSDRDEIDLHGLYVKEAEWILQQRIASDIQANQRQLKVIVGKGNHSKNGIAKLKPAIDQKLDGTGLNHWIDPQNSGVLVIDLTSGLSAQIPSSWNNNNNNNNNHQQQQPHYQQQQQPHYQQQQPHYQQQQQHSQQQYQNNNNNNNNNNLALINMVLKLVCMCINKR